MKLKVVLIAGVLIVQGAWAAPKPDKEMKAMLELADASRCLVCHDVDTTVTGPSWRDVAKRYRGNPEAESILVKRVFEGSSGNWGKESMSANKRAGLDNVQTLVRWILTLR